MTLSSLEHFVKLTGETNVYSELGRYREVCQCALYWKCNLQVSFQSIITNSSYQIIPTTVNTLSGIC